jgi:hypothetical protein
VVDSVKLEWTYRLIGSCTEHPSVLVENLTAADEGVTFRFEFGDGTTSQETEVRHTYENDGLYTVKLIAEREFCSFPEFVQLPIYTLMAPNVFTPEGTEGYNDEFQILFGDDMIAPADAGLKIQLSVHDRWGKTVFESLDYQNDWRAPTLASGIYYYQLQVADFPPCKNWLHIMR